MRREYGSHGSIDVIASSPLQSHMPSSESFFAMLKEYRPAVLEGHGGLGGHRPGHGGGHHNGHNGVHTRSPGAATGHSRGHSPAGHANNAVTVVDGNSVSVDDAVPHSAHSPCSDRFVIRVIESRL